MPTAPSAQESNVVYRARLPVKMFDKKRRFGFFTRPKKSMRDVYVHLAQLKKYGFTPSDMKKKGVEADVSYVVRPHGRLEAVNIHRIGHKYAQRRSQQMTSALRKYCPAAFRGRLVPAEVVYVCEERNFGFLQTSVPETPELFFRISEVPEYLKNHIRRGNWFRVCIEMERRDPVGILCHKIMYSNSADE